jgi:hypothetical protein
MRKFYKVNLKSFCANTEKKQGFIGRIAQSLRSSFSNNYNREDLCFNKDAFIKFRVYLI